jgi:predicted transcriptional regulator
VATSDPIELATEIMVAFVANNAVPRADLPALFEGLHSAVKRLADGGEVAPATIDPPAPAVSIRKSVTPDYLLTSANASARTGRGQAGASTAWR